MPRRNRHRRKSLKGGLFGFGDSSTSYDSTSYGQKPSMWDSFTSTLSGWGSSIKKGASDAYNTASTSMGTSNTSYNQYQSTTSYGGKTRKRHMKGGLHGYTPTTGLASQAASFSGPTAQVMVGGKKTKKYHGGKKHRHTKSCKHNKN